MTPKKQYNSIKEAVLKRIEKSNVRMRSHMYFVGRAVLIAFSITIITAAVVYLVSFIFFALNNSGAWLLPSFGWRGLGSFLTSFPWLLGTAVLVFIVVLELFVKRFSFAYRNPLMYSILIITILVFIGGFVVSKTPFHRGLYQRAFEGNAPITSPLYRHYGMMRFRNAYIGTVKDIQDIALRIEMDNGSTITFELLPNTHFHQKGSINIGDTVMVMGSRNGNTLKAFGVHKIDGYFNDTRTRMRMRMQNN